MLTILGSDFGSATGSELPDVLTCSFSDASSPTAVFKIRSFHSSGVSLSDSRDAADCLQTSAHLENDKGVLSSSFGCTVQASSQVILLAVFMIASWWSSVASFGGQLLTSGRGSQQIPADNQTGIDKKITISTASDWTDTDVTLEAGNVLQIAVPDGVALSTPESQHPCNSAVPSASVPNPLRVASSPPGVLVAKLAVNAQPFPVVTSRNISITSNGHLYLAPNSVDNSHRAIAVSIHTGPAASTIFKNKLSTAAQIWLKGQFGTDTAAAAPGGAPQANNARDTATGAPNVPSLPIDPSLREQIARLPRRVSDQFNNPGDMVNFVIIGSEEQVQKALANANWHIADTSNSDAVIRAIEMSRANQDYVQMPMSLLYLFGRPQDFGYEQAEPYAVVASRHHFRLWKAPFQYEGKPIWVGAGTHDIGFEKDQRNGRITHKIDPAVDGERQNIGESLEKTGLVAKITSYLPPNPVQSANNATGGEYHSDGRILIITLK